MAVANSREISRGRRDRRADCRGNAAFGGRRGLAETSEATEREIRQQPAMHRQGKKLRWHTKFGEIEVLEPQYRCETSAFVRSCVAQVVLGVFTAASARDHRLCRRSAFACAASGVSRIAVTTANMVNIAILRLTGLSRCVIISYRGRRRDCERPRRGCGGAANRRPCEAACSSPIRIASLSSCRPDGRSDRPASGSE